MIKKIVALCLCLNLAPALACELIDDTQNTAFSRILFSPSVVMKLAQKNYSLKKRTCRDGICEIGRVINLTISSGRRPKSDLKNVVILISDELDHMGTERGVDIVSSQGSVSGAPGKLTIEQALFEAISQIQTCR